MPLGFRKQIINAKNSQEELQLKTDDTGALHDFERRHSARNLDKFVEKYDAIEGRDFATICPRGLPADLLHKEGIYMYQRRMKIEPHDIEDGDEARLPPFAPFRTASDADNLHLLPTTTEERANRYLIDQDTEVQVGMVQNADIMYIDTENAKRKRKQAKRTKKKKTKKKPKKKPKPKEPEVSVVLHPPPPEEPPVEEPKVEEPPPEVVPPKEEPPPPPVEEEPEPPTAPPEEPPEEPVVMEDEPSPEEPPVIQEDEPLPAESTAEEPRSAFEEPPGEPPPSVPENLPNPSQPHMPSIHPIIPGASPPVPDKSTSSPQKHHTRRHSRHSSPPRRRQRRPPPKGRKPSPSSSSSSKSSKSSSSSDSGPDVMQLMLQMMMMQGMGGQGFGAPGYGPPPGAYGPPPPGAYGPPPPQCCPPPPCVPKKKKKKKKCCLSKPINIAKTNQGMNFDFLPEDDFCTEITVTIDPDEADPLECAMDNGVMPIVCCYVPPQFPQNGGSQAHRSSQPGSGGSNNQSGTTKSSNNKTGTTPGSNAKSKSKSSSYPTNDGVKEILPPPRNGGSGFNRKKSLNDDTFSTTVYSSS